MRNFSIIIVTALLLIGCNPKNANYVGDTEIYVKIIKEIGPNSNIKECIEFSDNRGSAHSLPGFPEYFMTRVNSGKKVTWMSHPDSEPKIGILEVNFKPNDLSKNILENTYLRGKKGIVSANVKQKGKVRNLSYEFYNITLMVNNKIYTIDPILQFHEE